VCSLFLCTHSAFSASSPCIDQLKKGLRTTISAAAMTRTNGGDDSLLIRRFLVSSSSRGVTEHQTEMDGAHALDRASTVRSLLIEHKVSQMVRVVIAERVSEKNCLSKSAAAVQVRLVFVASDTACRVMAHSTALSRTPRTVNDGVPARNRLVETRA